jgi:hypothetical protein
MKGDLLPATSIFVYILTQTLTILIKISQNRENLKKFAIYYTFSKQYM